MKKKTKQAADRRSSAKNIIAFIILVVTSGVVFFFGWLRIPLQPGQYAVIYTKTRGYRHNLVKAGDFVWKIERLLPTNLKYEIYSLESRRIMLEYEGSLPSGEVYAAALENGPEFGFIMEIELTVAIRPDFLIELVQRENLGPEDLSEWYERITAILRDKCVSYLSNNYTGLAESGYIGVDYSVLKQKLSAALTAAVPEIDVTAVYPHRLDFPDMDLYRMAKNFYTELAQKRQQERLDGIPTEIEYEAEKARLLRLLKDYGDLFRNYPELLDFLEIPGENVKSWLPALRDPE